MGDDWRAAVSAAGLFTPTVVPPGHDAPPEPQWSPAKPDDPLNRVHLSVTPFVPPRHPVGP